MSIVKRFVMLFLPKPKPTPKPPMAGETWYIKNESPWPKETQTVEIIDQKDGWVRYKLGDYIFTDERMELSRFTNRYRYLPL